MDKALQTIENLKSRRIEAKYFENREALINELLNEIGTDELVAFGGSVTLDKLGLYEKLTDRGNKVLWHWRVEKEKMLETRRQALLSDVYLVSCNALITDGRIVNIDGSGNRVAAMVFGPKKVRIIAGVNKLCSDYDEAMNRIKTIACPSNAKRLKLGTPCEKLDRCTDCKGANRMCAVTSIIEFKPSATDLKVYLVNEELGY